MDELEAAVGAAAAQISAALQALKLPSLPMLAAPVVLPASRREEIASACTRVRSALCRLAGPERWNPRVPMPDGLEPLISSERLGLERLGSCRLDALCNPDGSGLKFLEIQAGDPSGLGWVDAMAAALRAVPALAPWMKHWRPLLSGRTLQVLRALGGQLPTVAVVNEDGSFVVTDAALMASQLGLDADRVDPRSFAWDGARLTSGGKQYDVILRDSHEELTVAPGRAACEALWRALEAGFPRVNPFRDVWFDDKECFALLWGARASLPADERAAVEAYVPPTLRVDAANAAQLAAEQEQWVLKPAVGYGGFDVVVGAAVDARTWAEAVRRATTRRTVAQHFVAVGRPRVARLDAGGITWRAQHLTVSFWCHGGVFSGGYARAGDQPVVNVHQGGGIGPLVFS